MYTWASHSFNQTKATVPAYLSARGEVLDVVQGTGNRSDDSETVYCLKEDGILDEKIDANGEEGVKEKPHSQGLVHLSRWLAVLK